MIVNRKIPPLIQNIENVDYQEPFRNKLSGGADLYIMKGDEQEVVKLDLSFRAGSWYSKAKLESLMAAAMLQEGTSRYKASDIANTFDFYGAQFNSQSHYDNSYISLLSLKKHLPHLLPLLYEIISDSAFPENEFEIVRQKRKKKAIIDSEKVGIISQRSFLRTMFADDHPYSPVPDPDSFDLVTLEGAKTHFRKYYSSNRLTIIASGHLDNETEKLITDNLGKSWGMPVNDNLERSYPVYDQPGKEIFIEKPGANQNAVSIGKHLPVRNHPDFPELQLLCTILGGYFGSRLMSNLREDKGFTYSIQASPVSFVHDGVLLVFAEVKKEKTRESIREIYTEMEKLCEELISDHELSLVQNYMLGRILEEFDGPFARAHNFLSLRESNLSFEYYDRLIRTIRTATPHAIRETAVKYLSPKTMTCIVAGTM